jgi:hypothetical protein
MLDHWTDNILLTLSCAMIDYWTGLRDILLRHTNITQPPTDIWHTLNSQQAAVSRGCHSSAANPPGGKASSAAGGPNSSAAVGPFLLLDASLQLTIFKADDPAWLRVQLVGSFDSGFVGFGVALPGGLLD